MPDANARGNRAGYGLRIVAPAFVACQALLVYWAGNRELPPAPPDLKHFASEFSGWQQANENGIPEDVLAELKADRLLDRNYVNREGTMAELFVAWFQSQRSGKRQPHSPKVCLPGSGWTAVRTDQVTLATAAGAVTATTYLAVRGPARVVVLYWYQSPRRAIASEWAAKFWLVADGFRDRRTDAALVRITVPSESGKDDAAAGAACRFARDLYPLLRAHLNNNVKQALAVGAKVCEVTMAGGRS